MRRLAPLVLALALLPAVALAASAKKPAHRPHNYGFLPGYVQPPSNALPLFMQQREARAARRKGLPWYIDPVPSYLGWDGEWRYFGRPGFYRGRYDGGSFGPCWTRTPIGPVWNCG